MGDLLNLNALSNIKLMSLIKKASTELKHRVGIAGATSDSHSVMSFGQVSEAAGPSHTRSELKSPWVPLQILQFGLHESPGTQAPQLLRAQA